MSLAQNDSDPGVCLRLCLRCRDVHGDVESVVHRLLPRPQLMRRLALLLTCCLLNASEGEDAAKRLLARLPKGNAAALVWQNLSTMPAEEVERIRRTIESGVELQATGTELRITLAENPRGYLVVAEAGRGAVWMETWVRPTAAIEKPSYHLVRTLLWEQTTPILDIAVDRDRLYVLEPLRVTGKDVKPTALTLPRPMPRDPRGRIEVSGNDAVRILLPGVRCAGVLAKLPCMIAREPWIVAARNYFEGLWGRFYTSAEVSGVVFQAETDGRTRVYSGIGDALRVIEGWGSEIAPIESACGTHVLASLETDQLQAFQYAGGNIRATTVPLVLDGPVTALWPSEKKDQVTVIVNNRTTGNYEASRVAISCTQ